MDKCKDTKSKSKRGRKPLFESMTTDEIRIEIEELLEDLRTTDDIDEKKRIRRNLRRRGHNGGLGIKQSTRK